MRTVLMPFQIAVIKLYDEMVSSAAFILWESGSRKWGINCMTNQHNGHLYLFQFYTKDMGYGVRKPCVVNCFSTICYYGRVVHPRKFKPTTAPRQVVLLLWNFNTQTAENRLWSTRIWLFYDRPIPDHRWFCLEILHLKGFYSFVAHSCQMLNWFDPLHTCQRNA